MKKQIELGQRVKDKVSDFIGIAVARVTYLNGCVQIQVTPKAVEGKIINQWIDEIQLEVVDQGILPVEKKEKPEKLSTARNYRSSHNYGGMRSHPGQ